MTLWEKGQYWLLAFSSFPILFVFRYFPFWVVCTLDCLINGKGSYYCLDSLIDVDVKLSDIVFPIYKVL